MFCVWSAGGLEVCKLCDGVWSGICGLGVFVGLVVFVGFDLSAFGFAVIFRLLRDLWPEMGLVCFGVCCFGLCLFGWVVGLVVCISCLLGFGLFVVCGVRFWVK